MLQIRLLGQFDVRLDGRRIVISSRSGQSLLAYLAVTAGVAHRREKLAGILWPDTVDETARKNLRHELWRIRKAISKPEQASAGDYLIADEFTLTFNPEAEYWLDVVQMERPDLDLRALLANLSLYQGELLPGFYDEWATLERERVNAVFDARMEQLLEQLIAAERWVAVQEWGERWLALSGVREPAYRALMLASGVRGDMARVAAIYERCTKDLMDSLGVEPSAETRALYEGLRKGARTPLRPSTQPSGTITFLFTDIEGSTQLLDKLGDQYAEALGAHRDIMRAAIRTWNGHEMDTQGDSFFVTFARAKDAVQCAAEAQRGLSSYAWPRGETLRVRMGLHTGEPLIASTGYVGMDVHRAARIGDAAHGGQILLSQTTRELILQELPAGMAIRELGEHRLKDMKYPTPLFQLVVEGLPADFGPIRSKFSGAEAPAPGQPPFKGLEFFDESDSDLFFGRESLTARLADRLREADFLSVIIGASGSGKSSLVRAGLVPKLRSRYPGWRVHILTPTAHPLEALAIELTRDLESVTAAATLVDDLSKDPRSLHFFLARRGESRDPAHTLLVVDQFEELFTLCRDDFEREAFIDNLLMALTPPSLPLGEWKNGEGNITLVITLRADFYAHLAQYPELRDAVAQQQEYIGTMTAEELRRAIEQPAERGHWAFEPGLVDLILRDVGSEPGALPLLSHALLETWKRRAAHTLTLKGYADAGGVRGAIAHTAEGLYQTLSLSEQAITRNILLRLTEFGEGTEDTRRRASFDELVAQAEDEGEARAVLNRLAEARLITLSEGSAEVAHEALIREWPQLREWLSQDREGIILHRRLTEAAQEWELLERDQGSLYRGARLAQAREWSVLHPGGLNSGERAFLAASVEQEDQEALEREIQLERELQAAQKLAESETRAASRLRRRAMYLAGALGLVIIALFAAGLLYNRAEAEKQLATSRELALAANSNLDVDPELSILLSLQALSTARTGEAESALHNAVQTSRLRLTLERDEPLWGPVYSPDGTRLATLGGEAPENSVRIWDPTTGRELVSIQVTDAGAMQFSPEGSRLAVTSGDEAGVWDAATGQLILMLSGHTDWINDVDFSPDGTRLATASEDHAVKVWDLATGKEVLALDLADPVFKVQFTSDATQLLTSILSSTGDLSKVWDLATGKEVLTLSGGEPRYTPDGRRIATRYQDQVITWDAATGQQLHTLSLDDILTGSIFGPVWSADGTRLILPYFDRTVGVWDAATGGNLLTFPAPADNIAVDPDGTHIATDSLDGKIRVWDISPQGNREWLTLTGLEGISEGFPYGKKAKALAYSPDNSRLATSGPDNTAIIWDAETGEKLLTLAGHTDAVLGLAFSPDGSRVATSSRDLTIKVWDSSSGRELSTLSQPGHGDGMIGEVFSGIMDIAYSPDGKRLATAGADGTAVLWDTATGEALLTLDNKGRGIPDLAFSPDGARLATSGDFTEERDGSFRVINRIWDVATGKELLHVDVPSVDRVFGLAYSPDGKLLATGDFRGGVRIWDAQTGQELLTLPTETTRYLNQVTFSPDGSLLATADAGGITKLWDVSSGEEVLSLRGHTGTVTNVVFSPDGTRLATAGNDGTARVYLLNIDKLIALAQSRLTRSLTTEECQKYLHTDQCPPEP